NGVVDGFLRIVAAPEMQRQQLGNLFSAAAVEFFERLSDVAVISPAMSLQEAPVSGLLRQPMPEDVGASLGLDALEDEFETDQFTQQSFERPRAFPHRTQETE